MTSSSFATARASSGPSGSITDRSVPARISSRTFHWTAAMSYSFRSRSIVRSVRLALCLAATMSELVGLRAIAAETRVQPQMELRVESNTNKDLTPDPGPQIDSMGYIADLSLAVDRQTPRSDLQFVPRVRLQEYPDASEIERLEGFADLNWQYQWQRAQLNLAGSYSHQDVTNSEQPE